MFQNIEATGAENDKILNKNYRKAITHYPISILISLWFALR